MGIGTGSTKASLAQGGRNYNNETPLQMVERCARLEGLVSSQEELSAAFDRHYGHTIRALGSTADRSSITGVYCSYLHSMEARGTIHPEQAKYYRYVGEFA